MDSMGTMVLDLSVNQRGMAAGLAAAKKEATTAGRDIEATMNRSATNAAKTAEATSVAVSKRLTAISTATSKTGKEMTRNVTLPIIGMGAAAVKFASDFDAAMERVHTQSGESQKNVDALRGSVLALAKQSPQSPIDLANALYRLEGAGYRGAKAMDALRAASKLAAVGNANVEDTAKTLTQAMKPGIKGLGDFNNAVAQINATVGAGDMRLPQLIDALGTGVVTSAKQAGLSFKDVTAALAVFGDETNNVSGWSAQFATAMHYLYAPTKKAEDALNSIGLSGRQMSLDLNKPNGLLVALRDLKSHLGDLQDPRTKDILSSIFPGGRGRVITVLLNQTDLLAQKYKQIQGTQDQFTSDVAKTNELASTKIKKAWSTIQADAIQLGDALGPEFLKVGEGVANEADKIAEAFLKLPPQARQAIITGGLITAGIGPAMRLLGVFAGGVAQLIKAEQYATGLASGNKSLFGTVKGQSAGSGTAAALSRVAEMQVGQMTVASMAGGIGGVGKAASTETQLAAGESRSAGGVILPKGVTAPAAAAEESSGLSLASITGAVKGSLSKLAGAGMIAGAGVLASQLAGSMVGGSAGKKISGLGTGASLGAGLGSMIEPGIGTAVGAGIGAGVAEGISLIRKKGYGQQVADALTPGFGGANRQSLQKRIADQLDQAAKLTTPKRTVSNDQNAGMRPGVPGYQAPTVTIPKISQKNIAAANALYYKVGHEIAGQLEKGWAGYSFHTEPTMFKQFVGETKKLKPQAQAAALESAVAFSDKLEAQGKLASGSTNKFIKQVEKQFPGLVRYLGLQAGSGADAVRKKLDLSKSQQQLSSQIKKMRNDFDGLPDAMDAAGKDAQKQSQAMIKYLSNVPTDGSAKMRNKVNSDLLKVANALDNTKGKTSDATAAMVKAYQHVADNGTAPMRKQAQSDLNKLRSNTADSLQKTANSVINQTKKAANSAKSNFNHMQGDLTSTMTTIQNKTWTGMDSFANAVTTAMANGTLTTGKGMNLLITNLNRALKEMGQKQLSQIQVAVLSSSANNNAQLAAGQNPAGGRRAGGGLVNIGRPGEAGHDTVPLTVGGSDIVVGKGEQVAVFNRHQQPIVNRALAMAGYGGLNGLFNKVKTPNYLASGGIVQPGQGFAGGGTVGYAGLEGLWDKTGGPKNMAALMAAIAEAESGGNPGAHNPSGASGLWQILGLPFPGNVWDPLTNARMALAKYRSQGLGAWTTYTSGAYKSFLHGNVLANPNVSGGGSSWTDLVPPGIKGAGVIADIAKAAIKKATDAANKYGAAHAPAASGVGGSGPPTVPAGASKKQVQQAMFAAANRIVGLPYSYGGGHNPEFRGTPGYDCSGAVSYILHAGGFLNSPEAVGAGSGLETFGLPGPGKYITIAGRGTSGENAHTMMSMFGRYFESGGAGGQGPHWDQGWDGSWAVFRHPPGYAGGGVVGNFGDVPPEVLLRNNPTIASDPAFKAYASKRGMKFADGGLVPFAKGGKPKKPSHKLKATNVTQRQKDAWNAALKTALKQRVPKYKAYKLPTLKAPAGFDPKQLALFNSLGTKVTDYGNLLSELGNEFGLYGDVAPTVTFPQGTKLPAGVPLPQGASLNSDGTLAQDVEIANWGSPTSTGTMPTGYVDPSTNERTLGIYDRLAQIGVPGSYSESTLLGVEDLIQRTQYQEQGVAAMINAQLGPWASQQNRLKQTDDNEVAWLTRALDLTQIGPSMSKLNQQFANLGDVPGQPVLNVKGAPLAYVKDGNPIRVAQIVRDKVEEYRNAAAVIARWEKLKSKIPGQRKSENSDITRRYNAIRHKIQNGSSKTTYTNEQLLQDRLSVIQNQRDQALTKIPTKKPSDWKGSEAAWAAQRKQERSDTSNEYNARIDALRAAARKAGLKARLQKSAALYNLGQQEQIDKGTLSTTLDNESTKLQDLITGERTTSEDDKRWLTNLKAAIKTQSGQYKDAVSTAQSNTSGLSDALDPLGSLSMAIRQTANVDIPTLLQEMAQLKGTTTPVIPPDTTGTGSSTSSDNSDALLQIAQQQAANSQLAYQVLARQTAATSPADQVIPGLPKGYTVPKEWMASGGMIPQLPAYGGAFATGGIVPGREGEPRMILAHGREEVLTAQQSREKQQGSNTIPEVHVHIDRRSDLGQLIDTRIEMAGSTRARRAKYRLPSAGGGVQTAWGRR